MRIWGNSKYCALQYEIKLHVKLCFNWTSRTVDMAPNIWYDDVWRAKRFTANIVASSDLTQFVCIFSLFADIALQTASRKTLHKPDDIHCICDNTVFLTEHAQRTLYMLPFLWFDLVPEHSPIPCSFNSPAVYVYYTGAGLYKRSIALPNNYLNRKLHFCK